MQAYEQLEQVFSKTRYNVACSSGTAALHLALEALELPKGGVGHVLVPEFTMIACARAVTMAGLHPIFIDCDDNLNLDTDQLLDYITDNTVAIMPVHIYGRSCDMNSVHEHGIDVIEDMSEYHGRLCDNRSAAACWSFYKNKIIHGEEGGLISFQSSGVAKIAKCLRSHGFTDSHDFYHRPYGHNYRLSNCHANLILESLEKLQENLIGRARVEALYNKYIPIEFQMPSRDVCWVYDIRLRTLDKNMRIVEELNKKGIQARLGFKPMSMQPEYLGHYRHLNAYKQSRLIMYFPVSPIMTEEEVKSNVVEFLNLL